MIYIRWFKDLTIKDIPTVGGKNASLGEMYSKLTQKGVPVPNGFALTAEAYWKFMKDTGLDKKIKQTLHGLDVRNVRALAKAGEIVRNLILKAEFPKELKEEIVEAYRELSKQETVKSKQDGECDVAVRSSATAEDLPDASFAGQQESYLNVRGEKEILLAAKKCVASLFTNRAISYREAAGYDHMNVALSVGVQKMVRSDLGESGVMFTLDTESGYTGAVLINSSYGLGEYVVKGRVTPDQFYVYKEGVKQGLNSIISRKLGSKEVKLVYAAPRPGSGSRFGGSGTKQQKVPKSQQRKWSLKDAEVIQLAKWGMQIEEHYGRGMDIEWAKDGKTGKLFIVQARSETVKSRANVNIIETYKLKKHGEILAKGTSVGQKIGQGKVRIIQNPKDMKSFKPGEVLVTRITDPDWEPVMRVASAIVTEQGGKTSHAAIVSREIGVPCIVGAVNARKLIKSGSEVTVSCAEGEVGYVYKGRLPFEIEKMDIKVVPKTKTKIMMNVGDPDKAFTLAGIPNDGVGLAREEFIFTNFLKIHPMALVNYKEIRNKEIKKQIDELTLAYENKIDYAVDKLAEGMAFIAAGFAPNDVIVRLSDFKTNEYATLIGGTEYEPKEENPMIGWRGASRYYDPKFKPAFKLECEAIKKVREEWGLKNLIVMVPFCRTVEEGKKVLETMKEFGLERGKNGLQVYVMCEIPANVILAKEFSEIFDGFSIGSNDLTQLTLGVDRDSALVSHVYDENNAAVKKLIREVIQVAHKYKRKVGICGQAPSDYPEFAEFLVQEGIDSISLNPDTVLKTRQRIADMEKKLGNKPRKSQKLTSLLLTVCGIIGIGATILGASCQTLSGGDDQIKAQISAEVLQTKLEMKQELKKALAEQTTTYSESSESDGNRPPFNFFIRYPASWSFSRGTLAGDGKRITLSYPNNEKGQYGGVAFVMELYNKKRTESEYEYLKKSGDGFDFVTTTWQNYPGFSYTRRGAGFNWKVLDIYPKQLIKTKQYMHLTGDEKYFDQILQSIHIDFDPPQGG